MKPKKRKLSMLSEAELSLAKGGWDWQSTDIDPYGEGGSPLFGGGTGDEWIIEFEPLPYDFPTSGE